MPARRRRRGRRVRDLARVRPVDGTRWHATAARSSSTTSRPGRSRVRIALELAARSSVEPGDARARARPAVTVRVTAARVDAAAARRRHRRARPVRPRGSQALRIPWVDRLQALSGSLLGRGADLAGRRSRRRTRSPRCCRSSRAASRRGRRHRDPAGRPPRRPPLHAPAARSSARSRTLRDLLPGTYSFGLTGRGPDRRRSCPPGATRSGSPPGRSSAASRAGRSVLLPDRVGRARESSTESPFRIAQQQLQNVADAFGIDDDLVGVLGAVQEVGRGLDPDDDGRRLGPESSPAGGSPTTSRAARRRAASATTPASRSTRSRRSRCG